MSFVLEKINTMTIRPYTKNVFLICTSFYLFIFFFSLLFRGEEFFGLWGTVFVNLIAATCIYMFYFFQKYENIHIEDGKIQIRSKKKIIREIQVKDIKSFNKEDVYSNGVSSEGPVLKKLYRIQDKNGDIIFFSRKLYKREEVIKVLELCLIQNKEIESNIER